MYLARRLASGVQTAISNRVRPRNKREHHMTANRLPGDLRHVAGVGFASKASGCGLERHARHDNTKKEGSVKSPVFRFDRIPRFGEGELRRSRAYMT